MLIFTPQFSTSFSWAAQGDGEWGLWSVNHILSLLLLSSHALSLLQNGVPSMGDNPSQTSPAWVFSMGCSPSRTDCSSLGPLWVSQVLPGACSSMGSPMESQVPSGHIHLLWYGAIHGLQSGSLLHHGLQGDSLPNQSLYHGLQGNLCSRTWSTSYPSFSTDLVVCRVVALIYSLLSPSCCCAAVFPLS